MIWLLVGIIVMLVGVVIVLVRRKSGPERQLQGLCGGDAEQVWRLVMYERRRTPGISRREACRRALESYRRDNR